jgi:nucleotide-binding universal stress UspA family protein
LNAVKETGEPTCSVLVWVAERTWQGCVDAARLLPAASTRITLIHVSADDPQDAARGAYLGLMGRRPPGPDPGARIGDFELNSAAELLDAAAARLGRPCGKVARRGRPEREVVSAADGADLLIVARDGDQSRLGPKSLGKEPRFVVDHAPCPVLLIWPHATPSIATIPPKPPKP